MRKTKNVLYISFLGILEPVAFSQVFSYLVKLGREEDLKFTLLSFEKTKLLRQENGIEYQNLKEHLEKNNVEWRVLIHHRGIGKIYDFFIGFVYTAFLIIKNKIKIIHARSNEPVVLAYIASKIFNVRIVYDRRGIMADDYSDDANTSFRISKNGRAYRFIEWFETRIMRACNAVVVLTHKIFSHLDKDPFFKEKKNIFVIPCCVDLNRFSQFLKDESSLMADLRLQDKFIFNYTGSLYNIHCFSEMLDLFAAAKEIIPNAHFLFLSMTDKNIIESQIRFKKMDMKDFTITAAAPSRVNEYLSICDASMMFFKPTFNKLAASPVKFAECLASGLPVIINKGIGDTQELIRQNKVGVVLDGFSKAAYQDALAKLLALLKEPDIRSRCRRAAEDNLSLRFGAQKYKDIYCNI